MRGEKKEAGLDSGMRMQEEAPGKRGDPHVKDMAEERTGKEMRIVEMKERTPLLVQQLLDVWEGSVRATHLFLLDGEIDKIKGYVPQAIREIPHLIVGENDEGIPSAFMGIDGQKLEMLFVSREERGRGFGKALLEYGMEVYSVNELAVNEQNPQAKGFYEHMGFRVHRRTDCDEQGNPYPLLYMKLEG